MKISRHAISTSSRLVVRTTVIDTISTCEYSKHLPIAHEARVEHARTHVEAHVFRRCTVDTRDHSSFVATEKRFWLCFHCSTCSSAHTASHTCSCLRHVLLAGKQQKKILTSLTLLKQPTCVCSILRYFLLISKQDCLARRKDRVQQRRGSRELPEAETGPGSDPHSRTGESCALYLFPCLLALGNPHRIKKNDEGFGVDCYSLLLTRILTAAAAVPPPPPLGGTR